ncbi:unnamed protein product [Ectocarpus fasciculatus]
MAFVLTSQLQFLATLSFVDHTGAKDSAFYDLTNSLRWVNLWPSESFSDGVASRVLSDEFGQTSEEDDTTPRGISQTLTSDVSSLLFMGNLVLFMGLLVIIYTLHILVASAVEAYWVAKQRAKNAVPAAELRQRLFGRESVITHHSVWPTDGVSSYILSGQQ